MNPDHPHSEPNPYQVPQADVATLDTGEFHEPRATPAGNGKQWISDAWQLFKVAPGMWIAMFVVYAACQIVLGFVPFAGSIFMPVFVAGFYRAAQTATDEGVVRMDDLFSGFRERLGPLIVVGVLTMVFISVTVVVCMGIAMAVMGSAFIDSTNGAPALLPILVMSLIIAALIFPVLMMSWFSPALVIFQGMGAIEAMKCSFRACLRNVMPFTIYSLILLAMLLLAIIPLGLGLLVVFPIMMLTAYTSYHDIFIAND